MLLGSLLRARLPRATALAAVPARLVGPRASWLAAAWVRHHHCVCRTYHWRVSPEQALRVLAARVRSAARRKSERRTGRRERAACASRATTAPPWAPRRRHDGRDRAPLRATWRHDAEAEDEVRDRTRRELEDARVDLSSEHWHAGGSSSLIRKVALLEVAAAAAGVDGAVMMFVSAGTVHRVPRSLASNSSSCKRLSSRTSKRDTRMSCSSQIIPAFVASTGRARRHRPPG